MNVVVKGHKGLTRAGLHRHLVAKEQHAKLQPAELMTVLLSFLFVDISFNKYSPLRRLADSCPGPTAVNVSTLTIIYSSKKCKV